MPIQPKPFTLKCPKCGWSKRIRPKSDVVDMSWGLAYVQCPECGAKTIKEYDTSLIDGVLEEIKKVWS